MLLFKVEITQWTDPPTDIHIARVLIFNKEIRCLGECESIEAYIAVGGGEFNTIYVGSARKTRPRGIPVLLEGKAVSFETRLKSPGPAVVLLS